MTNLRNSNEEYGCLAKLFHWVIALLIIFMLVLGNFLSDLPKDMMANGYMVHKSIGVLILALVFVRFVWRLVNKQPELDVSYSKWIKLGAKLGHVALYGLMFAMPISGWIFGASAEHPLSFFNLFELPIVTDDKEIRGLAKDTHDLLANAFLYVLSLHIVAAFYHHYFLKDNVLRRMLPSCCGKKSCCK